MTETLESNWIKILGSKYGSCEPPTLYNPEQAGGGGAESAHRLVIPSAVLKWW